MSRPYNPPEAKVAEMLSRFTPRQLAIGYLRAQHRARGAEVAFHLMASVNDMTLSAVTGDYKGARNAVETAKTHLRTSKEPSE
ncbi:hypothetical protein T8T21_08610 [Limimaricola variabilis]|uniref:hypothetical protein n=1 Tax=Limimaricola variabilis TaxID=1492771 RepID=UPI002AC89D10|nr:hypothetical protein [Limimaricola variabilis]WPY93188.1 hypothetical protein T8T21_08610 [Limimaricola variabilis]